MRTDEFGDRMKGYEAASDSVLPARLPVIVRLDGNSFSRYTELAKYDKPFDARFENAMDTAATATADYLGAVCAYVQSDEITLLLLNDRSNDDTPFLGNRIQKLCSLSAATCATAFYSASGVVASVFPIFDCRVFVVPPSDVNNAFLWRQKDAFKNFVGSTLYYALRATESVKVATKRMAGLTTAQRQEVLFQEFGINVNDAPVIRKRGRVVARQTFERPLREAMPSKVFERLLGEGKVTESQTVQRRSWVVDNDIPLFNDGQYLDRIIGEFRAS